MQPTTATQSTMNKTHTDATHPKSYYTYSGMPKSRRDHIWKSISYKKIHHLHHFNTPHTLHDSPVEFWKLKRERPSGGNVCVCASRFVILYVSFCLCEQFWNQVSQLQKWWMHMDTLQFFISPIVLRSGHPFLPVAGRTAGRHQPRFLRAVHWSEQAWTVTGGYPLPISQQLKVCWC